MLSRLSRNWRLHEPQNSFRWFTTHWLYPYEMIFCKRHITRLMSTAECVYRIWKKIFVCQCCVTKDIKTVYIIIVFYHIYGSQSNNTITSFNLRILRCERYGISNYCDVPVTYEITWMPVTPDIRTPPGTSSQCRTSVVYTFGTFRCSAPRNAVIVMVVLFYQPMS